MMIFCNKAKLHAIVKTFIKAFIHVFLKLFETYTAQECYEKLKI